MGPERPGGAVSVALAGTSPASYTDHGMSTAGAPEGWELVVGPDGSIPAEQLARLGFRPGAHLRVVAEQPARSHRSAYGVLAGEPAPSWADYEAASRLAIADAEGGPTYPGL